MHCPQCGHSSLRVSVVFTGAIACEFQSEEEFELLDSVSLESEWDDDSACECLSCDWRGRVREARSAVADRSADERGESRQGEERAMLTEEYLQDIKDRLAVGYCNPLWRGYLEDLIAEVERLHSLLETITCLSSRSRTSDRDDLDRDDFDSTDDTVVA